MLHQAQHRLSRIEPHEGLVEVQFEFRWRPDAPAPIVLTDPSFDLEVTSEGRPLLAEEVRPIVVEERFEDAAGRELAADWAEGRCTLPWPEGGVLRGRRLLHIQNRSEGAPVQHPFAASLTPRTLVFRGGDLCLEPAAEAPSPHVVFECALPEPWTLVSVEGPGPRFEPSDLAELRRNFLIAGSDLEVREHRPRELRCFLAASRSDFAGGPQILQQVASLADAAVDAFGELAGSRLIVLQRLQGSVHQRLLGQRGASAPRSLLAYVDLESQPAYQEHPLAVVAHEITHWWNPRSLRLPQGLDMYWFSEGLATYYEGLLLARVGLISLQEWAQTIVDLWVREAEIARRGRVSLVQASRAFLQEPWAPAVVYRRGALLGLWLDVELRKSGSNRSSLDLLLRRLLFRTTVSPQVFDEQGVAAEASLLGRDELGNELLGHIHSEGLPPWREALAALGFAVEERRIAYLGVQVGKEPRATVSFVQPRSPAESLLEVGDVIVRLGEVELTEGVALSPILSAIAPDSRVPLSVERAGQRLDLEVTLGSRPAPLAIPRPSLTSAQAALRREILQPPRVLGR